MAAIDRHFDYSVPESMDADVRVGTMVRIALHGRRVGGWVVEDDVTPPAGVTVRPIAKVTGWGPPPSLVALSEWAAWRWAGPRARFLGTASPPGAVRSLPVLVHAEPVRAARHARERLVEEAFAAGKAMVRLPPAADRRALVHAAMEYQHPALVLVPSVAQAEAMGRALRSDGASVAVVPGEWAAAAAGARVVIGARAAAWAPLPRVGAVVVLDAHDEVYQEERAPTWNAWQVAAERAARDGAPCVLISPCPTVEQIRWGTLVTTTRAEERAGWPAVEVLDRRGDDPRSGLFSDRLVTVLRGDGRVVCVLNRKGRARLLACAKCGELCRCERCGAAVEQRDVGLRCHGCGLERPALCLECGSLQLKRLRLGVTRVREELAALVGEPVGEITGEEADEPDARVVVGTEAVLHQVRRAGTVVFLDFDQELLAPRFRAAEQAMSLLGRAARVVGGRKGRIAVQTRLPDHDVLAAAVAADPGLLADREADRRRELSQPPFAAWALVSGDAAPDLVDGLPATVDTAGPDDGRWLVRGQSHEVLCDALALAGRPPGRLRVEVDPLRA